MTFWPHCSKQKASGDLPISQMKSPKSNNPKKLSNNDSFLEAFRDLGADIASTATDNLKAGAGDIKDAFFPFPKSTGSEKPADGFFSQNESQAERKYRSLSQRTELIHKEEKILFTRQQRETQQQVNSLQEEIKKLAKATSDLASEAKQAEIAAMHELPAVGTYHLNFFEQLRKAIASLRTQIQESSLWLSSWNKKAQKKDYFWGQFKKSGSKFLLSSDRYMSTQAG